MEQAFIDARSHSGILLQGIFMPAYQARYRTILSCLHAFIAVLFACLCALPAPADAEGALRPAPSCQLDAEDQQAVRQASEATAAACADAASPACLAAQAQQRQLVRGYCSADPCSLGIDAMPVTRNRIAARSIEDFLEGAAEASQSGWGEIGSFRWTVNSLSEGPGHRFTALNAGGAMVLPVIDGNEAPPADQALIYKAMRIIAAHEARHRDAFLAVARQACADISSRVGDTNDIFRKYFCATGPGSNAAAQRQVDLMDGLTKLVITQDGRKDIVTTGVSHAASSYITAGLCE